MPEHQSPTDPPLPILGGEGKDTPAIPVRFFNPIDIARDTVFVLASIVVAYFAVDYTFEHGMRWLGYKVFYPTKIASILLLAILSYWIAAQWGRQPWLPRLLRSFLVAILVGCAGLLFGYDLGLSIIASLIFSSIGLIITLFTTPYRKPSTKKSRS